jgi:putative methyltransferase (TIGR04325 family)
LTLFTEPQFNWPLLATLFKVANNYGGSLGVLDFGGAFGNVYFQHKKAFPKLKTRWCVVETKKITDMGRKELQDNELIFYESISDCMSNENINVLVMSGVLQCLETPELILAELLEKRISAVVVDRIPISNKKENFLTIQKLGKDMGNVSQPHWFFDKTLFCEQFYRNGYQLTAEWKGFDWANIRGTEFKGFVFEQITADPS